MRSVLYETGELSPSTANHILSSENKAGFIVHILLRVSKGSGDALHGDFRNRPPERPGRLHLMCRQLTEATKPGYMSLFSVFCASAPSQMLMVLGFVVLHISPAILAITRTTQQ